MLGLLLGLVLGLSDAHAQGCPWGTVRSASATMTTVTVNGTLYPVRGLLPRTAFYQTLMACGENDAAYYFDRWRQRRRWTNIGIVAGFPSVGAFWIAAGVTAVGAGVNKELMLEALEPDAMM